MNTHDLHAAVDRYFDALDHELQDMKRRRVLTHSPADARFEEWLSEKKSDLLELWLLVLFTEVADSATPENLLSGAYVAALSPSPDWAGASRVRLKKDTLELWARTGLEVASEADSAEAELDLALVGLGMSLEHGRVAGRFVRAGAECKAHSSELSKGTVRETCFKGQQVWTALPSRSSASTWWEGKLEASWKDVRGVAKVVGATGQVPRFALVTQLKGTSENALTLLREYGLELYIGAQAKEWVDAVLSALAEEHARAAHPKLSWAEVRGIVTPEGDDA
ncbi:MAG: hypothetical protein H6741_10750 [Alphaproteobacteria bacterium]|nr:hypothetical protein [Alphaproteobacteria bacterium]